MTPKALSVFLGISFTLWLAAREHETGGGVFRGPARRFLALSRADRAVLTALIIVCCRYAATNPAAAAAVTSAVPGVSLEPLNLSGGAAPGALTPAQYAAGFLRVSAATIPAAWLAAPSNAVVHAPWAAYGVAEDVFWLPATNWSFTLGTNQADGLHVSSSGLVSFQKPLSTPRPSSVPADASLLAPLHGSLGLAPPEGRFWHAPTGSNSLLLTWENLYAGRETNCPVSFQAELSGNGDFRFRYQIPAGSALRSGGRAVGDQRGMGDRENLSQHGGHAGMTRLTNLQTKHLRCQRVQRSEPHSIPIA